MKKKKYEQPTVALVVVHVVNHLLEGSPIPTGEPDKPAGSREGKYVWEDED